MGSNRVTAAILAIVALLVALSIHTITTRETVLGLDLRGGIELVYQGTPTPQAPEVTGDDIDDAIEIIRQRVDALGVAEPEIARIGEDQVSVGLPAIHDAQRAIDQVGETAQLYFYDFERLVQPPNPELEGAEERPYNRLYEATVAASQREPECPENACTTNGPTLYLFDSQSLELLSGPVSAGGDDEAALEQARADLLFTVGGERPEGSEIVSVPQGTVVLQQEERNREPGVELTEEERQIGRGWFVMSDEPGLSGDDIRDPQQNFDPQTNRPIVTFSFSDEGRAAFHEITRAIAQRGQEKAFGPISAAEASGLSDHFAVALDGEIVSRPIINFQQNPDGIDGRTGAQISGTFSIQEAQDLARFLRIGALPVNLTLISQSSVSATLGQEALEQGLRAGIAGLACVLLFLIFYYRFLGIIAALGLTIYALIIFALINAIPITLTLPGIAGLVLTYGIAADSNIVIFERIKEEVGRGRSIWSAITEGYRRGISTIIDANVITLITAFILFVLATGGVKGFAFTLGIGTLASLFTAVIFTRAILAAISRSKLARSERMFGAREAKRWNFDFAGASKWFFMISGLILVVGAVALSVKQLNFGIDFESGMRAEVALVEPATPEEVRQALSEAGVEGMEGAQIQETAPDDPSEEVGNEIQIRAPLEAGDADIVGLVQRTLEEQFGIAVGEEGDTRFDSNVVGPTFGEAVARSAVIAIILSLLVISGYVAIRFEPKYAIPVIIATFHDLLIAGGIYALSGREVSSATVAAFLTIVGLSLYDSVIVFDRIRENVPRLPRAAFSQIVNRSISEVLTRTIVTGATTLFVISALLFFGGETLQDFAFAMLIGILSGFYSSIFIATPTLMHWKEREPMYRNRRKRLEEVMGYVPTFPEDNEVARLDATDKDEAADGDQPEADGRGAGRPTRPAPAARATPALSEPEPGVVAEAERGGDADASSRPDRSTGDGDGSAAAGKAKKRRQKKSRNRKHGRHR